MTEYIATFYSHYGAVCFKKNCEKLGIGTKIMPVPRNLSSSCGTCVRFWMEQEFSEAAYMRLCHTWVRGRQAVGSLPPLTVCGRSLPYKWLQQFLRTDYLTIEGKNVPL